MERKSFGVMVKQEEGSRLEIINESYVGHIPVEEIPGYTRATYYSCPYTGEPRTCLSYTSIAPIKIIEATDHYSETE